MIVISSLSFLFIYCFIIICEKIINNNNKTYHWKSIYNEFNKWSRYNIFEDAFNDFIKKFYFKISQIKKNTPRMLKQ